MAGAMVLTPSKEKQWRWTETLFSFLVVFWLIHCNGISNRDDNRRRGDSVSLSYI